MKSIAIAVISIFIGITIAIPIKDHEIDELVMRVNELRRLNPVQGGGSQKNLLKSNEIGGVHRRKRAIDLDRNPLLYGYYSGVLNNIYDKRSNNINNENDGHSLKKVLILQDSFQPSDYTASLLDEPYGKRNFDEIDRALIGGLKKRLFSYRLPQLLNNYENGNRMDISSKRNFDEIDRAGFTTLKRNFDEIDRAGFVGLKRSYLNKNPSSSSSLSGDNLNMEKRNAI